VIPSPKDHEEAAVASSSGDLKEADARVMKYAQAQVARRQLLASHGWVSVEIPASEWAKVVEEQSQKQASSSSEGGAAKLERVKQQYLGVLLQHAVEEYDTRKMLDHEHEHGEEGGCGSGCGHKH
jgi:hypothetical protein